MAFRVVILAAGSGKRMHSSLPKVLHTIANKTLLEHVVQTASSLNPKEPVFIVYGHQGETVRRMLPNLPATWIEQNEQLGTGHALQQALPHISDNNQVLLLYGDVPLITDETLQRLLLGTPRDTLGVITATVENPLGFGRIVRDASGHIQQIVEEKDATESIKKIREINTGIYLMEAKHLQKWLPKLTNQNAQEEYYLTDIIAMACKDNVPIRSIAPTAIEEILGVNNRSQLAQLERYYQRKMAEEWLEKGVSFADPDRFDLRGKLFAGQDIFIDVNVILEGEVHIGNHCKIGPNTLLRNVTLKDHVEVLANCVLEGTTIESHCKIGPFARIRTNTVLADHVEVGNFIEIKNSILGAFTKAHHVGYLGDSEIGKKVNIGAGTITCNYDGANKHKTIIGDNAFIGSNSELVAPIKIGHNATIGAGSTITKDAPPDQLTLTRGEQRTIKNWQRKKKILKETI
ncbi:MAG TPA: bifunctional UDP-N-acetylglucosamine diphosphorylase/glucosamine-1-phosphate N-acetyltransferase GlmU [Gammaproteobacteria bacterium]|jgi:bifunctional UDP-N-acetylglucosamine pyrophosphorylase/glucosamine-1-phosphate N-acetyltransferase|nr:bifunctional UDP-N-acetylglucosamine diphosphorylase/glucosamine-1-phosphate N-acetyltransferase GlmU [Gammaproteobacteria bacterium]